MVSSTDFDTIIIFKRLSYIKERNCGRKGWE